MKNILFCFPKGKYKALTMSYDDGRIADKKLINIFNKYGIKGTFHLNSGLINESDGIDEYGERVSREEIKELYKGHEVAAHTKTHQVLERCPVIQATREILEDKFSLEDIVGYAVRGFSYPYGSYNSAIKEILKNSDIEYSRVVEESENFDIPKDFYEWRATCRHTNNLLEITEKFLKINRKEKLSLFYVWGHSYEFNRDNNWFIIEEFARKIGHREEIWYATNIEIVEYIKAFNNLKFTGDGNWVYNPSFNSVWISADKKIYKIKGGEEKNLKML